MSEEIKSILEVALGDEESAMVHISNFMQEYQSVKKVKAALIIDVQKGLEGTHLTELTICDPLEKGIQAPYMATNDMVVRHMPEPGDYLVLYDDGYVSISPAKAFNDGYLPVRGIAGSDYLMDFGAAIDFVRSGAKIARKGWNGKGMFVVYQKGYPEGIPCNKQTAEAWGMNEGDLFKCRPYLQLKTADGSHCMWSPSVSDVLGDDWVIVNS
ncbi:DUF2829 domain-containing protein [Vibrio quintilis]|uniref:Thoeris anti-defense 2-like domain-containing protein n=1 Tax=Vibrio quintilis TaxID=1117707 RepID=A0A1M7YP46_9VIBR|nr:DUF2829 domain-containing protein [Vibrio quintilis]SHO54403.1 hypothetical protein VQ7734_00117 [Vibrio quintilis]